MHGSNLNRYRFWLHYGECFEDGSDRCRETSFETVKLLCLERTAPRPRIVAEEMDAVWYFLLRIFTSIFIKDNVRNYFSCEIFICLCYQGNAGFIELENVQPSSTVWKSLRKFSVDSSLKVW